MKLIQSYKKTFNRFIHAIYPIIYRNDLIKLCIFYGTKWKSSKHMDEHMYAQHYEKHFTKLRRKKLKILEIGIDGYDNTNAGGGSLKLVKYLNPSDL